jgi:phosphoglycolate phosphatase
VKLTAEDQRRFFRQMPVELRQNARNAQFIIYPGVRELLETLSARKDVILGLVTGNVAAAARIKLEQFDLHHHFVLGAFGDDHADRGDIARLALDRVREKMPAGAKMKACFLIGDTPHDIAAAKAIGAAAVAVATGKFNTEALKAAGAEHVLSDLSDTPGVLRILGLGAAA